MSTPFVYNMNSTNAQRIPLLLLYTRSLKSVQQEPHHLCHHRLLRAQFAALGCSGLLPVIIYQWEIYHLPFIKGVRWIKLGNWVPDPATQKRYKFQEMLNFYSTQAFCIHFKNYKHVPRRSVTVSFTQQRTEKSDRLPKEHTQYPSNYSSSIDRPETPETRNHEQADAVSAWDCTFYGCLPYVLLVFMCQS